MPALRDKNRSALGGGKQWCAAALVAAAFAGCNDRGSVNSPVHGGGKSSETTDAHNRARGSRVLESDRLRRLQPSELTAEIARHRGRWVLVEFWATWCGPCVEQLPQIHALHARLTGRRLDVVRVSLDDPKNEADVLRVLGEAGIVEPGFISANGESDETWEGFGIDNSALPHYRLYDPVGAEQTRFVSGDPGQSAPRAAAIERAIVAAIDQRR